MSDSDRDNRPQDIGQGFAVLASILLCCIIVAVVTYSWARQSANSDQRAAYYQAEAERNQQAICVGRVGGLLAECLEEQRQSSRDAYTAEKDLNAQRDMALWAQWMFIVSAITAGLTMWALWYVRGTLIATREALEDTGDATEAMVRQNTITFERERAHLKYIHTHAFDKEGKLELWLTFKNMGVSLAEVDGISIDAHDYGIWPQALSDASKGLQIRIAPNEIERVKFECVSPVRLPCYFMGFITYKTLGFPDQKSHFALKVDMQQSPYGGEDNRLCTSIPEILPNDT